MPRVERTVTLVLSEGGGEELGRMQDSLGCVLTVSLCF